MRKSQDSTEITEKRVNRKIQWDKPRTVKKFAYANEQNKPEQPKNLWLIKQKKSIHLNILIILYFVCLFFILYFVCLLFFIFFLCLLFFILFILFYFVCFVFLYNIFAKTVLHKQKGEKEKSEDKREKSENVRKSTEITEKRVSVKFELKEGKNQWDKRRTVKKCA